MSVRFIGFYAVYWSLALIELLTKPEEKSGCVIYRVLYSLLVTSTNRRAGHARVTV